MQAVGALTLHTGGGTITNAQGIKNARGSIFGELRRLHKMEAAADMITFFEWTKKKGKNFLRNIMTAITSHLEDCARIEKFEDRNNKFMAKSNKVCKHSLKFLFHKNYCPTVCLSLYGERT